MTEITKQSYPEVKLLDLQKRSQDYFVNDRSLPPLSLTKQTKSPIITHNQKATTVQSIFKDDFVFPEYNFADINRVIETEPLIARVFDRKITLCVKEGFEIVSKNQKLSEYLKIRFKEIEQKTGIGFRTLVEEAITGLVRYSNHFFVFKRDKKNSSGLVRSVEGKRLDPIAGIYSVPIETVKMRFNSNGHCDAITQDLSPFGFYGYLNPKTEMPIYDHNNFVHLYMYYYGGISVCPPMLVGVKEDIIALRKIEENYELLLYQYLFPLYHYQVGTPELPAREYPDGTTEVGRTANTVASLPSEGCVVTSHRHNIEVLGSAKQALDPIPALEWYKKRVLAGVAASALDLGEGDTANRSTSDTLSRLIIDFCKYVQNQVAAMFENVIFSQLLYESTFGSIDFDDPENKITLKFKEIDLDSQTKKENHITQLYTQNMITHPEARLDLGRDILEESEKEELLLYQEQAFQKENAEIAAKQKAQLSTSGQAQGAARSQPSNQYGKKGNSEKRKSSVQDYIRSANPLNYKNSLGLAWSSWNDAKLYIQRFPERKRNILLMVLGSIKDNFTSHLITKFKEGANDCAQERNTFIRAEISIRDTYLISSEIERLFNKLIVDAMTIDDLNRLDYRMTLIECAEQSRAYNFGRLRALKALGVEESEVFKVQEDKKVLISKLPTGADYVSVPPTMHPNSEEIVEWPS